MADEVKDMRTEGGIADELAENAMKATPVTEPLADDSETAEEKDQTKPEAEAKAKANEAASKAKAEPEKKTEPPEPTVAELKAEIAKLEKRFKDTQGNWTREHQARIDLEKKMAELEEARKRESDPEWVEPTPESKRLEKLEKEIAESREAQKKQESLARWNALEDTFRKDHGDYDSVIESFQPEWEKSPELQEQFRELGGTPEAAYKLGREILAKAEERDPVKIRERIKRELLAELEASGVVPKKKPAETETHQTLGDMNNMTVNADEAARPHSVLDEVLSNK